MRASMEKTPFPQHANSDNRSDRVVTRVSDLPKGGYYIDLYDKLKFSNADRERIAVWSVAPLGTSSKEFVGGQPVWVVVADGFEKDIQFYSHRRNIERAGYRIERVVIASEKLLIRTIQDSHIEEKIDSSERNSIIEFYEEVVSVALRENASDIHIELRRSHAVIRMRKHGQMMVYRELPTKFCWDLCSVIYGVLAEDKDVSFMPSDYQAAGVTTRIQSQEVRLRYQSLPASPEGFDVVMRVLKITEEDEGTPDLSLLGYSPTQNEDLMKIVSKPVGALIIAGTTGSGKSTTLKNLLMLINESRGYRCKIYTIEDPPEYRIPRVSQIPVVRRRGVDYTKKSPFEDPLVATMRGDPDILMIGEIRDVFTGDGLKKATQSGHQVLTTLHASSALGCTERLADFSITPSVMGSPEFINGLVYQKLLPLICPACSISFNERINSSSATASEIALAKRLRRVATLGEDDIRVRNPKGCEKCKGLGVVGRTVCAEVIAPDFTMRRLFREGAAIEAKMYWRSLSDRDRNSEDMTGKPAIEHALWKMRRGLVSPYDIEDQLGPVDSAEKELEDMERDAHMLRGSQGGSVPGKPEGKRGVWDMNL